MDDIKKRIALVCMLLDKAKVPLLSDLTGSFFPRFFDFKDDDLDDRINEIEDKPELESTDLLELAACYFIMFLKSELD